MPENKKYGELNHSSIGTTSAGLNLENLDIDKKMSLTMKHNTVKDVFMVFHYKLG